MTALSLMRLLPETGRIVSGSVELAGQDLLALPEAALPTGRRPRIAVILPEPATRPAGGPALLIADEPTTALDVTIQAQVLELLRDLQRRNGMAILLITHDLGIVAQMAHRVAVIYAGQVV